MILQTWGCTECTEPFVFCRVAYTLAEEGFKILVGATLVGKNFIPPETDPIIAEILLKGTDFALKYVLNARKKHISKERILWIIGSEMLADLNNASCGVSS